MKKCKIGEVYELPTPKGKAYLQYAYKDKMLGYLIRVLIGLYKTRPNNFSEITEREQFWIFFPLSTALNQNTIELVGFSDLKAIIKPKYMRAIHEIKGEIKGWYIVDTDTWQREFVENLTKEQKRLSPWGIWNDTLLIDRLTEGWTLDKW